MEQLIEPCPAMGSEPLSGAIVNGLVGTAVQEAKEVVTHLTTMLHPLRTQAAGSLDGHDDLMSLGQAGENLRQVHFIDFIMLRRQAEHGRLE